MQLTVDGADAQNKSVESPGKKSPNAAGLKSPNRSPGKSPGKSPSRSPNRKLGKSPRMSTGGFSPNTVGKVISKHQFLQAMEIEMEKVTEINESKIEL